MKFGKNLTQQQSKHPELRFLDYKELKKILKLEEQIFGSNRIAADQHFRDSLDREIGIVNACFSRRVCEIRDLLDQQIFFASSGVTDHLRQVMRIADQVEVLRRFAVWNAVGVVKILKKRAKLAIALSGSAPADFSSESWLSKQLFYSGSDFAELQAILDDMAGNLSRTRMAELSGKLAPQLAILPLSSTENSASERCPICLEKCIDAVELTSCGHRFCWKCVVLGPIAFAPGDYRLSRCSVCRNEQPLDPTKNFKSVVSNELILLSQLVSGIPEQQQSPVVYDMGLEDLYGSSSGARRPASSSSSLGAPKGDVDESHNPASFFCSLCCEPLLLEAITTTPCKHHFHRVCLQKHAERTCPLCDCELPLEIVVPRYTWTPPMMYPMYRGMSPQWVHPSVEEPAGMPTTFQGEPAGTPITVQGGPKKYITKSGIEIVSFDRELIERKQKLAIEYSHM